jgi:hypothetical protein
MRPGMLVPRAAILASSSSLRSAAAFLALKLLMLAQNSREGTAAIWRGSHCAVACLRLESAAIAASISD